MWSWVLIFQFEDHFSHNEIHLSRSTTTICCACQILISIDEIVWTHHRYGWSHITLQIEDVRHINSSSTRSLHVQGIRIQPVWPTFQWYTSLLNASIGSFAGLHGAFVKQFVNKMRVEKYPNDLYAVNQRENETLRSFVARFLTCNVDTTRGASESNLLASYLGSTKQNLNLTQK